MAPVIRGNSLYTIVPSTSGGRGANDWISTKTNAQALGGDLVVFETRQEEADLLKILKEIPGGGQGLTIGMTFDETGKSSWNNGAPVTYERWMEGGWTPTRHGAKSGYVGIAAEYYGDGSRGWDASIDGSWGWNGLAEIPLTLAISRTGSVKEGAGVFTTSINLYAGTQTSGNLANGTTVYWSVTGITADDLASGALTGSGTITNGKLDIQHSLKIDADTGEILNLSVFSDSSYTQQIGSTFSASIIEINPTYSLTPSSTSISEGSILTTTVGTTNVTSGTTLYYSLSGTGITASDFSSGALMGSGTVASNGTFTFSHTLANDLTTEGTETLAIKLFSDSARNVQVGTTASVTVADTSKAVPYIEINKVENHPEIPWWWHNMNENASTVEGTVTRIGSDALPPDPNLQKGYRFPADIRLNSQTLKLKNGQMLPLQVGMSLTANIKLRKVTYLQLLLSSFRQKADSLRSI